MIIFFDDWYYYRNEFEYIVLRSMEFSEHRASVYRRAAQGFMGNTAP